LEKSGSASIAIELRGILAGGKRRTSSSQGTFESFGSFGSFGTFEAFEAFESFVGGTHVVPQADNAERSARTERSERLERLERSERFRAVAWDLTIRPGSHESGNVAHDID
jgi:hypothetical protein